MAPERWLIDGVEVVRKMAGGDEDSVAFMRELAKTYSEPGDLVHGVGSGALGALQSYARLTGRTVDALLDETLDAFGDVLLNRNDPEP